MRLNAVGLFYVKYVSIKSNNVLKDALIMSKLNSLKPFKR